MKHLFMFTIGPVKSFIDNSRKVRDLYAGSKMLSSLMAEAVNWLNNKNIKVLFPVELEKQETPNMPNRLVAEFEDVTEAQLKKTAEQLSACIQETFLTNCLAILEKTGIDQKGLKMAEKQLFDFLEIYWCFEDFESDFLEEEDAYRNTYQKLFKTIHDVKSVRRFGQTEEPWGRKCMLFPEYNAIFAKGQKQGENSEYPYHVNRNYVYDISEKDSLQYAVKDNEALSAIALVKRMYSVNETRIFSIRQMLLRSRVSEEQFQAAELIKKGNYQMDDIANVVYELEHGNTQLEDTYSEETIYAANDLYKIIKNDVKLSAYYALVKFDGDNMGNHFIERNKKEQQELSRTISQFAKVAPDILSRHGGLPIFAGGEDFLGFLPLDTLFACLQELYEKFHEITKLTFSVGIAIAHLMQPLKEVMAFVEEMESTAKNMDEKNAFAIGIIKRSGTMVTLPAYHLPNEKMQFQPDLENVWELICLLKDSGCSRSLFFQISLLLEPLMQNDEKPDLDLVSALLKQSMTASMVDSSHISKEALLQKLHMFYQAAINGKDFLQTLNGIAFLAREVI